MTTPTIFEQLTALSARVDALEVRATVETTGLATAASVTAIADRVAVLESEVGSPSDQGA